MVQETKIGFVVAGVVQKSNKVATSCVWGLLHA